MITYLTGSATDPQTPGTKIVAHICNDIGAWGRGFVLSVTQQWPQAEAAYRSWYQQNNESDPEWKLGSVQFVDVGNDTKVANMIAQHGILPKFGIPPIRYDALESCLTTLAKVAKVTNASVHMPRIGCGLAGGKWSNVEKLIDSQLSGVDVYVYDFNTGDARTIPWNK